MSQIDAHDNTCEDSHLDLKGRPDAARVDIPHFQIHPDCRGRPGTTGRQRHWGEHFILSLAAHKSTKGAR